MGSHIWFPIYGWISIIIYGCSYELPYMDSYMCIILPYNGIYMWVKGTDICTKYMNSMVRTKLYDYRSYTHYLCTCKCHIKMKNPLYFTQIRKIESMLYHILPHSAVSSLSDSTSVLESDIKQITSSVVGVTTAELGCLVFFFCAGGLFNTAAATYSGSAAVESSKHLWNFKYRW